MCVAHRHLLSGVTGVGRGGVVACSQERVCFAGVVVVPRAERSQSLSACQAETTLSRKRDVERGRDSGQAL